MKTAIGIRQPVSNCGHRPRALIAALACLALATATSAPAEDITSVLAPTPTASGVAKAAHTGNAGPSANNAVSSGMNSYPIETEYYDGDGGWGWECGEGCPPSMRVRAEWLEFMRNREGDSLTNAFPFNDFPYHEGIRVTIDGRWDCTHGWESVYAGLFDWQQETFATGNATLNTTLGEGPGINLSTFQGADSQTQRYDSELHSFESLYKCWGWDVIAVGWGMRYINLLEQLNFRSVDPIDGVGLVRVDTDNHLVMGELNVEMFFPIGRWSFDSTWKFCLGTNLGDNVVFISNDGVPQINREDQDYEFAAMLEGGTFVRYFLTSRLAVRAGYEFWWIYGVGLANDQIDSFVTLGTGSDFRGEEHIFVHGGSVGIEFGW